eukprot:3776502-Alexandrium_andersonii.AAC.1
MLLPLGALRASRCGACAGLGRLPLPQALSGVTGGCRGGARIDRGLTAPCCRSGPARAHAG